MIELLELDRGECLRLVAATSGRVGRIAVDDPGSPPIVRPVNYVFDERSQSVLFRSVPGSKLSAVLDSATAVFEIDGGDPVERTGWSVIIVGEAEEVTDRAEIDRLDDLQLEPWAPGAKAHWVRIRTTSASGRRILRTFAATPQRPQVGLKSSVARSSPIGMISAQPAGDGGESVVHRFRQDSHARTPRNVLVDPEHVAASTIAQRPRHTPRPYAELLAFLTPRRDQAKTR